MEKPKLINLHTVPFVIITNNFLIREKLTIAMSNFWVLSVGYWIEHFTWIISLKSMHGSCWNFGKQMCVRITGTLLTIWMVNSPFNLMCLDTCNVIKTPSVRDLKCCPLSRNMRRPQFMITLASHWTSRLLLGFNILNNAGQNPHITFWTFPRCGLMTIHI